MSKKADVKIFCNNIKYLRKKYNFSKTQMAKKLGVTIKTLTVIENGTIPTKMSCKVLENIHINFDIPPTGIFIPLENQEK